MYAGLVVLALALLAQGEQGVVVLGVAGQVAELVIPHKDTSWNYFLQNGRQQGNNRVLVRRQGTLNHGPLASSVPELRA